MFQTKLMIEAQNITLIHDLPMNTPPESLLAKFDVKPIDLRAGDLILEIIHKLDISEYD